MLKQIYIHNYKCLVGLELELKETVLLLGDNGSGKTAVLDALSGLRELLSGAVRITDLVAFQLRVLQVALRRTIRRKSSTIRGRTAVSSCDVTSPRSLPHSLLML